MPRICACGLIYINEIPEHQKCYQGCNLNSKPCAKKVTFRPTHHSERIPTSATKAPKAQSNHFSKRYGKTAKCTYCGDPATTTDHVIPRSRGGTNTKDNLVPACATCNSLKSNFLLS